MATAVKMHGQHPSEGGRVFVPLRAIVATILLAAASLLVWYAWQDSKADRAMKALVEACGKNRVIEPRLSGGFHAGEQTPEPAGSRSRKTAGVGQFPGVDAERLQEACALAAEAAFDGDDAEGQMAYARFNLIKGDTGSALSLLEKVVGRLPKSAEAQNDLGACLVERGSFAEAIDRFNHALEIKPRMPEALLNRALCYNRLHLREAARDDLSLLASVERDRSWLREINERLEEASSPFADPPSIVPTTTRFESAYDANNLEEARSLIYDNAEMMVGYAIRGLTVNYLQAAIDGDLGRAGRAIGMINMIDGALRDFSNETFLGEVVRYITSLRGDGRVAELELIKDHLAATALLNTDIEQAQPAFKRLRESFASRRNEAYEEIATYYYARCQYSRHEYRASIETLKDALRIVEKHQWPTLKIQVLLQMAIAHTMLGEDSIALDQCKMALKLCRNVANLPVLEAKTLQFMSMPYYMPIFRSGMGEELIDRAQSVATTEGRSNLPVLEAKTLQYMSVPYWRLGNLDRGLELIREATDLLVAKFPNPDELAHNYLLAADLYRLRGYHRLSLEFVTQSHRFAWNAKRKDHNRSAQALSLMAVQQARLKEPQKAQESLAQAIEHLNQLQNPKQRNYTGSLVYTRGGEAAALGGDTDLAVEYYTNAEEMAASAEENKIPTLRALRGRAEAQIAAGRLDEAEADLQKALTLIFQCREGILERENRNDFFEASQSVFEQRLLLSLRRRGLTPEALDLSEESRARTLLDDLTTEKNGGAANAQPAEAEPTAGSPAGEELPSAGTGMPLKLADVQVWLPEGMTLLVFSVTSQGTYIFLVTKTGFEARESEANTEEIDGLVRDLLSDINKRAAQDGLKRKARLLYERLLGPVEGLLGGRENLCVVPDKALHFLPFGALVDRDDKYLIESYNLSYAPSASVLVRCIEEGLKKESSEEERMLAVGDPVFDAAKFPRLKELPDSRDEAEAVAGLYNGLPLIGRDASEARVREEIKTCHVAHLAMHCLVEEKNPEFAALVLSNATRRPAGGQHEMGKEGLDDGMLHLSEVYGLELPRTKMVVLSACESALGQYYRGEGMVSLVRPFIAKQVPTVVASYWAVESRSTSELMIKFHQYRKLKNFGAAEALRRAQRDLAAENSTSHPYFWAPFVVVGYSK